VAPGDKSKMISIDMLKAEFMRRGYACDEQWWEGKCYVRVTGPESDGWQWITRRGLVYYPFVDFAAVQLSKLKDVAYEAAASLGLTVPATIRADQATHEQRTAFIEQYAPVVVKPLDGSGSRGITLDVRAVADAERAIAFASNGGGVLMQRQYSGQEVRLTVFRGTVVSAILRQTPQLKGDGHSTVATLLARENEERAGLASEWLTYPQLTEAIIDGELLQSQEVLSEGETRELSRATMVSRGASLYNVTDEIHDSYKHAALRYAQGISPDFVVVDLMIDDYTQPLTPDNYVFLESNCSPSLKLYYGVRDGRIFDIVPLIADAIIVSRTRL
jgi:cyanophycin synthetase